MYSVMATAGAVKAEGELEVTMERSVFGVRMLGCTAASGAQRRPHLSPLFTCV